MKFDRLISVTSDQLKRLQAAKPEAHQALIEELFELNRRRRLQNFEQDIVAPSEAEYAQRLDVPNVANLPLTYLSPYLSHLVKWANELTTCLLDGKADGAAFSIEMVQVAVMELTLTMMEDGAPIRRLWLGDQGDMRRGDAEELETICLNGESSVETKDEGEPPLFGDLITRLSKRSAAAEAMVAGEPFNTEDLFGGEVPSFEELPDCGDSPCPACDARRAYFAERKVH